MRRVSFEKERVAGCQKIGLIAVAIVRFAFQHIDRLNAFMLERPKNVSLI